MNIVGLLIICVIRSSLFLIIDYGLILPFYPNVEREAIKMTDGEFSNQILIFYAVGTVRSGKVKERMITFRISVAGAVLLRFFWVYPMLVGLMGCFGGSGC